nr:polyhomeotic protein 2 [Hymenolepis microstoma]
MKNGLQALIDNIIHTKYIRRPLDRNFENMMDASEIGLIPVHQQQQPRSESHDLSIQPTTPEAPPTLGLSSPPAGSPMMDNHPSPASLSKLEESTMRNSHPHSVHTPEGGTMNIGGQIKRKRGRPRKYNYDPAFPPQVPVTSARLSLPASLTDIKTAGLMSPTSDTESAKKPRLGRPPLKETPKSPNVDISESADANGEQKEKSKVNQHQHLASQQQENNHPQQQQNHLPVQHHAQKTLSNHETNKHQATGARPVTQSSTLIAYPLPINGHGSAIGLTTAPTPTDASAPGQPLPPVPQSTTNVATGPVSMKTAALMMDYYNSPFIATQLSGPAAALMSPQPPSTLPIQSPNPAAAYSTVDINLLQRLLPQVGAAVAATRSGGYPGPHTWTKEMVASFISMLSGCQSAASAFIENDIDGQALLVLGQQELISNMKLKLGPAAKIAGAIRTLRYAFMSIPAVELSADHAAAMSSATSRFPALATASPALTGNNSLMVNAPFSINNLNGNGDNQIGH